MKTLNYLKKTAKHLFICEDERDGSKFYMKVFVDEKENTYTVLKLNEELEVEKSTIKKIPEDWVTSSGKILPSIDIDFSYLLPVNYWYHHFYKTRSVKHFKKINGIIDNYFVILQNNSKNT